MAAQKKYKKEFCEMLVKHMSQGYSFASFPAVIGVCRTTLYEWEKNRPAFKKAKKQGEAAALKMFERILTAKISGQKIDNFDPKKSDTACLIFALKTRFHRQYGEKQKLEHSSPDGSMTPKAAQVNVYIPKNNREKEG